MGKNISRKDFLKSAAMSAAGIGLFGAGAFNAKAEEAVEYKNSSSWVVASQRGPGAAGSEGWELKV